VARPGKNSAHAVEEWLIRPADRPLDDPEPEDFGRDASEHSETGTGSEPIGADVAQWIVGSPDGRNGHATEVAEAPPPSTRKAERRVEEPATEDATDSGLAKAEQALVEQRANVRELEKRLRQRETELAKAQLERDEAL
jgi:hypothetical protein